MNNLIMSRINSFMSGNDKRPLVIDVSSPDELSDLHNSFLLKKQINIFDLVTKTELPIMSDILEFMRKETSDVCFVYGLGTFLKLQGPDYFDKEIHSLVGQSFFTRFVIITYQCSKLFNEKNPRYRDKILTSKVSNNISSSLIFIRKKGLSVDSCSGLKEALKKYEKASNEKIYLNTDYSKSDFKKSLITIEECNSSFDLLCLKDSNVAKLRPAYGTEEQWANLLQKAKTKKILNYIEETIGTEDLISEIKRWSEKSSFEKWLLFIYLKIRGIKTKNWVIDYSINVSNSEKEFVKNIYWAILSTNYKDANYWNNYKEWKQIISCLSDDTLIFQFCNYLKSMNEKAIYYMTDCSDTERKMILQIIASNYNCFTKDKLMNILEHVYKDLYYYLGDYKFKDDFLSNYFNTYKYLKVLNVLTPEFKMLVENESVERSFKRRLQYRSEIIEELDYAGSKVYFIDALGVEFLNYIEKKCYEKGLACRTMICKSNLPSITSKNTEFRDFFSSNGIDCVDIKDLDHLKHDGKEDYDFEKNKLPIHLVEELKVIEKHIININKKIKSQDIKKAIIVSDHGATRLAILNTDMIKIDVESVGEHGGRVCKFVPNMDVIPNAIIEENYCILADYNSFKGGRTGKVEMHGGATLEEVTVPIIEITEKSVSVDIIVKTPVVKVSFKKNGILMFFSSSKLMKPFIRINGNEYKVDSIDDFNFKVELSDIKKAGDYLFDVWDNDELVSSGNKFKVEKESGSTNDLWG